MVRTQIQLPNDLYQRAKAHAAARELSLAEMTRRGLELFLDRFPEPGGERKVWKPPVVRSGGIKVPLENLREISLEDEEVRAIARQ